MSELWKIFILDDKGCEMPASLDEALAWQLAKKGIIRRTDIAPDLLVSTAYLPLHDFMENRFETIVMSSRPEERITVHRGTRQEAIATHDNVVEQLRQHRDLTGEE